MMPNFTKQYLTTTIYTLQSDLDAPNAWTYDWLLKFNPSKCSVLKINSKRSQTYFMNGTPLTTTNK